jgi:hypothetical protein
MTLPYCGCVTSVMVSVAPGFASVASALTGIVSGLSDGSSGIVVLSPGPTGRRRGDARDLFRLVHRPRAEFLELQIVQRQIFGGIAEDEG